MNGENTAPVYAVWKDSRCPPPRDGANREWLKTAEEVVSFIEAHCDKGLGIQTLDLDSAADSVKVLEWLEENRVCEAALIDIRFHGKDAAVIEKMREILRRNGWSEIG